jgi:hypothetical protein
VRYFQQAFLPEDSLWGFQRLYVDIPIKFGIQPRSSHIRNSTHSLSFIQLPICRRYDDPSFGGKINTHPAPRGKKLQSVWGD